MSRTEEDLARAQIAAINRLAAATVYAAALATHNAGHGRAMEAVRAFQKDTRYD